MTGGKALDRVVAVLADTGQGTGVLLNRRNVLTAWHVVEHSRSIVVAHPSSYQPVACHLGWADEARDAALLIAEDDVISAERAAPLGRLRFGRVATGEPLEHCQIVGFPAVQRYGAGGEDLEYDQFRASVLPMAGRMRDVLVCELDRSAVEERASAAASPLAGLSGAPVFAGPVLLGVVTRVPRERRHLRIEGVSVGALWERLFAAPRQKVRLEDVTDVHPQDEEFEAQYAKDLTSQYRKTEIFGIDELGRGESRWDLDTAYLSLQAEAGSAAAGAWAARGREWGTGRVENLLARRPRALLRGEAGAGKTTLVWWLAAHAAGGTLNAGLTELNGLVPFVIPLREVHARGGRFPSAMELLSAGRALTDDPPDGWTRRVLEAGRALLLVDGLDEVPASEREQARGWLSTLLDRYPLTRCLATVRPNAVDENWLGEDGFDELTLLPMSNEDIRAFVHAWHNAARLECEHFYDTRRSREEQELLAALEADLLNQLEQTPALGELARSPLLCAVICALHRRRRGLLPTTRWQLYRAALAMLLGGRDAGRGVLHADHVALDSDDQHALLQRLAIWLVRTGQQQMTRDQALHQLELAVRDMPHIHEQGTPDRILRFLLDRSGLLQERADDAIQFIHRTFQDFLAAKEFHESGFLLELLEHARSEAWRDVIVLAVGHTTRPEVRHLVGSLIDLGDAAEERPERYVLHALAARCTTSVQSLNAELAEAVKDRVAALIPPLDREEVEDLASLGDWVVGLLPDGEELRERIAMNTVRLLARVRSAKARRKLRQCVSHPEALIRTEVVRGWDLHPLEEYVDEVLADAHVPEAWVDTPAKLGQLPRLASVDAVTVSGSFPAASLDAHLPVRRLTTLVLRNNGVMESVDFLRGRVDLAHLELQVCTAVRDLSVLSELGLKTLRVTGGIPATLKPHAGVHHLEVGIEHAGCLENLEQWPNLRALTVEGYSRDPAWVLRAALRAPRLTRIALAVESLDSLAALTPLPRVERLMITGLRDCADTGRLSRVFPGLGRLALCLVGGATIDLRGLHGLPGLRVELWGDVPEGADITGAEAFGGRLRTQQGVIY